ncbi:hypothetical protein LIPSTDRAFT_307714 [Lipomyces starkeyi NRRL Y-11557]|uniref:Uncharacterized protein n=1 Tax=Lipomyces starkeyi NRRL Y-11557 TaxID=675824 RepID=A0A1E3Q500_LIPST|nr:hypothetical protein LIPSTDRAFT_307714 [Lipomyces starkeyi NRRL Y-11557]
MSLFTGSHAAPPANLCPASLPAAITTGAAHPDSPQESWSVCPSLSSPSEFRHLNGYLRSLFLSAPSVLRSVFCQQWCPGSSGRLVSDQPAGARTMSECIRSFATEFYPLLEGSSSCSHILLVSLSKQCTKTATTTNPSLYIRMDRTILRARGQKNRRTHLYPRCTYYYFASNKNKDTKIERTRRKSGTFL